MDALLEDTNDDDDDDDNKTEFRRQRDNNLEQFDRAFANIWQFTGGFYAHRKVADVHSWKVVTADCTCECVSK